jgi:ATPase subunit of ABC transporter with duplicated ATPase domains
VVSSISVLNLFQFRSSRFTEAGMNRSSLIFKNVSFTYERAGKPLLQNLSVHFPIGWSGIVGVNGAGKTTLLRLATAELDPQQGQILYSGQTAYCPQRTDDPPKNATTFLGDTDGEARRLRGLLAIEVDWEERWDNLSHGERKRLQIGTALWSRSEVLALDEPTNHIDAYVRDLLASALKTFRGVGLLVSHDRELLDTLCRQCVFVDPPNAVVRTGNYSEATRQLQREEEHRRKERRKAKSVCARLRHAVVKRREDAARSNQRRSKRGLALGDHDARAKKDLSRVTGKDGQTGRRLAQLSGRFSQAEKRLEETRVKKTYQLGIWVPGERSRRNYLLRLPEDKLRLGRDKQLTFPELIVQPADRVALTGPNGSGKSTLIRHIVSRVNVDFDNLVYLSQEIDLAASRQIIDNVRSLPKDRLARAMTVVSRLNSRPERLLESDSPSPGEIRKLLLALGIATGPHLIIMDEPTNHLDLPSIECLEQALSDCPCALLLASHDRRFLDNLTTINWQIEAGSKEANLNIFLP